MAETGRQLGRHIIDTHKTMADMDIIEQDGKKRKWSRQWSVWSIVSGESVRSIESKESVVNPQVKGAPKSFMKKLSLKPYFPYWPIHIFFIMVIFLLYYYITWL